MTLRQRRAFKERNMGKRNGMVGGGLMFLARHRRTVLCLVLAGIIAIGAGLVVVWIF